MKRLCVYLAFLMLIFMVSCQLRGANGITTDNIVGLWRMELAGEVWGPWLFLNEDGTFAFTNVPNPEENVLADKHSVTGQFELQGNVLTFHYGAESAECSGGMSSFAIVLTDDSKLEGTEVETDCPLPFPGPVYTYVRISK